MRWPSETEGSFHRGKGECSSVPDRCLAAWCSRGAVQREALLNAGLTESFPKQRVKCGISVRFVPLSKLSCLSIWPLFNVSRMKHASRGRAECRTRSLLQRLQSKILAQSSDNASLWWYSYLLLKNSSAVITWHQRPLRIRTNKEKCSGGFRRRGELGLPCPAVLEPRLCARVLKLMCFFSFGVCLKISRG